MKRLIPLTIFLLGLSQAAHADVWRWVDANGDTHFVDTNRPIYTWTDEYGKVHYSDKPDHADAVSVQLVWHSSGSLEDLESTPEARSKEDPMAYPGETPEQAAERKAAEAYYCKRANEILESYLNAPQLYRTNEAGERQILTESEMAATIADARVKTRELCGQ